MPLTQMVDSIDGYLSFAYFANHGVRGKKHSNFDFKS